jgi:hemerythrin-like domain-containing protein
MPHGGPLDDPDRRRAFLTIAGAGVLLAACRKGERAEPERLAASTSAQSAPTTSARQAPKQEKGEDVGATEDLMREHGVIRRILVIYRESAARLRVKPASVPPDALQKATKLMRSFGEDYHEKQLEEAHIFPALTQGGGAIATHVTTLIAQHVRGREITDYILAVTQKAIGAANSGPLAGTLEAFARMYEEHAALEDTVVFPAWKKALTPERLDEMGDLFEVIERKTFGKDGFDDAVDQVAAIEKALGIDLGALTAPPPPTPR